MNDIAIRVENPGKRYRIGGPQVRYKTLRESIVGAVTGPLHRNTQHAPRNMEHRRYLRFAICDLRFAETPLEPRQTLRQ